MSFQDPESGVPPLGRANGRQRDPSSAPTAGAFILVTAVNSFRNLVYSLGTAKGTPWEREKMHQKRQQIGQLVKDVCAIPEQASESHEQNENLEGHTRGTTAIDGVQEIFKDLTVLVHNQGAQIDDIHSNIENSCCNCPWQNPTFKSIQDTQVKFISDVLSLGDFWDCLSHRDHIPHSVITEVRSYFSVFYGPTWKLLDDHAKER